MSYKSFSFALILFISHTASAAECPTGFIAAVEHTLPVADICPTGYVAMGQIASCPGNTTCVLTCPIGYLLKTDTGAFAPLNPGPAPSPALHISDGSASCWAELAIGAASDSINIMQNGQVYHTVR